MSLFDLCLGRGRTRPDAADCQVRARGSGMDEANGKPQTARLLDDLRAGRRDDHRLGHLHAPGQPRAARANALIGWVVSGIGVRCASPWRSRGWPGAAGGGGIQAYVEREFGPTAGLPRRVELSGFRTGSRNAAVAVAAASAIVVRRRRQLRRPGVIVRCRDRLSSSCSPPSTAIGVRAAGGVSDRDGA